MGYLRTKSFLIFSDPDAPAEVKNIDPQKIAEIERAHEHNKKVRIDHLLLETLMQASGEDCTWWQAITDKRLELAVTLIKALTQIQTQAENIGSEFYSTLEQPQYLAEELAYGPRKELTDAAEDAIKDATEFSNAHEAVAKTMADAIMAVKEAINAMEETEANVLKQLASESQGKIWTEIIQTTQKLATDEASFKKYISETFRSAAEKDKRDFAWAIREILISKATYPDNRYMPRRTFESTVRFKGNGYLGINVQLHGESFDIEKKDYLLDGSQRATLWVKIVDGWSDGDNWGGCLRVACETQKGEYVDSIIMHNTPMTSPEHNFTFYDMGNYYEIWQGDRKSGIPLSINNNYLVLAPGATPGKWNLEDSTGD